MEYENFCKQFGIKLKYYRLVNKMSQEKLAEMVEVDPHYISDIECGRRNITFKTLYKIASAMKLNIYKLFQFE